MATRGGPGAGGFDLAGFLPYRLSALSGLTQRLLEATLARGGVTIAQWRVYVCLVTHGPSPLNRIVAFTSLPQSSLSRSIAAMHERGLVRNARDAADRRLARIEITPRGRRDFEALTASIEAACADAFRLSADEEARLIRRLDELIARLSAWRRREADAGTGAARSGLGTPARPSRPARTEPARRAPAQSRPPARSAASRPPARPAASRPPARPARAVAAAAAPAPVSRASRRTPPAPGRAPRRTRSDADRGEPT